MADQAIVSSLVLSHSAEARKLCRENRLACSGPAKEEIAIALIGARRTKTSRRALVQLLAYNMDGALGEDFNCYILNSGRTIKEDLISIEPVQLVNSCREKVDRIVAGLKQTSATFESTGVCASQEQIQSKEKQFSGAIDRGEKCSDEDF